MKLYYAPGTCALACWIALEWAGAAYEVRKVSPSSEEYRKVNPLGMVPALDIGTHRIMTQADAILQYIAERFEEKNLGAEEGLDSRFEFNETMSFLTGDFHPAFWPFFVPQRYTTRSDPESLDAVRAASHERIGRVLAHLDQLIGDTAHVFGNRRTVADAYAFVMTRWTANIPKTWREYKNVARFMEAMALDTAVSHVLEQSKA